MTTTRRHFFVTIVGLVVFVVLAGTVAWRQRQSPTAGMNNDGTTTAINHPLIDQYGLRPSQAFAALPVLTESIMALYPTFSLNQFNFAADNEVIRLEGQEYLVLRGCPDEACSNKLTVVFYRPADQAVYVLHGVANADDGDDSFRVEVFGEPGETLRQALLYFYSSR